MSRRMSFKISAYVDQKTVEKLSEIKERFGMNQSTAVRFAILTFDDASSKVKKFKIDSAQTAEER